MRARAGRAARAVRADELERWLEDELQKIHADERIHYPTATVEVNAPLALIQLSLETRRDCYRKVLVFLRERPT